MEMSVLVLPKISIITPSYNQGQYLEDTIQSVISQKYPNFEYIIIDGGSSDDSVSIIKKYDNFITYWISEPDHGQTHAINKGLQHVTGEIIAYINSDDQYCPCAFFTVAQYFMDHPDIGMLYGDLEVIDSEGKLKYRKKYKTINLDALLSGYPIPQPSTFFRKSVIHNVGLLNESLHYSMDYDFWIRIFSKYSVDHISSFLGRFRIHSESKTISQAIFFHIDIVDIIHKLLQTEMLPDTTNELICLLCEHCIHLLVYLKTDYEINDRATSVIAFYINENTYAIRDIESLVSYIYDEKENNYDMIKFQAFLKDYFTHYLSKTQKLHFETNLQKKSDALIFQIPRIFLGYDRKMATTVFNKFILMDSRFLFDKNFYILLYRLFLPVTAQKFIKPYLDSLVHTM